MARHRAKVRARLLLLARDRETLQRAKTELDGGKGQVLAIVCDVSDRQHVLHAIESAVQQFGRIDVLINNAGGPLEHATYEYLPARDERPLLGCAALHRSSAAVHTPASLGAHHQHRIDWRVDRDTARGTPHLTITPQAKLAAILERLMPNTMGRTVALTTRLLPGPVGPRGNEAAPGRDSRTAKLPRLFTALGDRAALRNNEQFVTR